jgi:hypothetical protein
MLGTSKTCRSALPAVFAAVALAVAAAVAGAATADPRIEKVGSLYRVEWGVVAYGFDTAWRAESLWERAADGTYSRVTNPDPAKLAACRKILLHRIGVPTLGQIAAEGESELQSLRSLGYI